MSTLRIWRLAAVCSAALMATPALPQASAATPTNDLRGDALAVDLPVSVDGTTTDAGLEPGESAACTSGIAASVWYTATARTAGRVVVALSARGDLDAAIEIVRRQRSQLINEGCTQTDEDGRASMVFTARAGAVYLIRVMQRAGSVPGDFRLEAFVPRPAPRPPGATLGARGATGTVDPLENTMDAYSRVLREGVTYKVNLSPGGRCVTLRIFAPGARRFGDAGGDLVRSCGGYLLITPRAGQGGRWSFVPTATGQRGAATYRLMLARAAGDDLSPGLTLRNHATARGTLEGGLIDAVDIYRFDVMTRSHLVLRLKTAAANGFDLSLLTFSGRRIASVRGEEGSIDLRKGVRAGRYLAVVRARNREHGGYTLTRVARSFTRTTLTVDGGRSARIAPGGTVQLAATVTPATAGSLRVVVERYDALTGWHYDRTLHLRVAGGRATAAFQPPREGSWRASALFLGTRDAAPSNHRGFVRWLVAAPMAP